MMPEPVLTKNRVDDYGGKAPGSVEFWWCSSSSSSSSSSSVSTETGLRISVVNISVEALCGIGRVF